jgi:hypothetical protein
MKKFIVKHLKLISLVFVLSVFACSAITVSAVSNRYSTSQNSNFSRANYDNSTYYLKTEYHVGSTAPWDDAYIYTEAGANVLKYRIVSYSFGNYSHTTANASLWGGNPAVQCINDGVEIPSQDTATGWCYAETLSGSSASDSIVNYQQLTIS